MKRYIFATGNAHKLSEIKEILKGEVSSDVEILSMADVGVNVNPIENGRTFADNAFIKARAVAGILKSRDFKEDGDWVVFADDSGLCVDAFDGEPGIHSARFMEGHSYFERNTAILNRLNEMGDVDRGARFVCAVALVFPDGSEQIFESDMVGEIANEICGENGFGYDPIFYLPQYNKTSAEISPKEKNEISHRGKALRMAVRSLE